MQVGLASNCRLDFCVDNKTQTHQVKEVVVNIYNGVDFSLLGQEMYL